MTGSLTVALPQSDAKTPQKTRGSGILSTHGHVGTAWLGPQLGVITIVVLSAFNYDAPTSTIGGAVAWLVSWLVAGFVYAPFTSPSRANPRNFGELMNRLASLEARRDELCNAPEPGIVYPNTSRGACSEATIHLTWVRDQTTSGGEMRWVNGAGYIAIWERLHRAEEALLGAEPPDRLLDEALHDELRLKDSAIPNRESLLAILRTVRNFLCSRTPDKSADPCIKTDEAAAAALKEVRFSVNDYRDSNWNGLLQLRNQTMTTLLLTNITLFALVAAAIVGGAGSHAILAATVFYLAGAVIGLFNRLNQQFQAPAAIEDYGLTMARLVALPVYSGLAAVAGVVITVLAGTAAGTKTPDLTSVFSIPPGVGLLVVAAAFGAAPDLVLKRLSDASEKFRNGINSTEPANRA